MKWLIILAEVPDDHPLAKFPPGEISLRHELIVKGPPELRGQQIIYHQKWHEPDVPPS